MDYSKATFWYLIVRDVGPMGLMLLFCALAFIFGCAGLLGAALSRRVRAARHGGA